MAELILKDIPYERSADPMSNRMCGAAALSMVYRSLGLDSSQGDLWPSVAVRTVLGQVGAAAHLLTADALQRGLDAVMFRAREPLNVLRRGQEDSVRLILNHRLHFESPAGHFTVFLGMGEEHVVLHDPQQGPALRHLQADLLKLWEPGDVPSEVVGRVLIAIGMRQNGAPPCPVCGSAVPESLRCPACDQPISLRPGSVLGCMKDACSGRTWEWLFCPNCAAAVVDASGKLASGSAGAAPTPTADPRRLDEVTKALEDLALKLEAAQPLNPDPALRYYLDECRSAQTELKQLRAAEEAARREAAAREAAAASRPKPAAKVRAPDPGPIDGAALGLQLLRELGLLPPGAPAPQPPLGQEPVPKEPPAKPAKKAPPKQDDYERFRRAVERASKPTGGETDYGTLK